MSMNFLRNATIVLGGGASFVLGSLVTALAFDSIASKMTSEQQAAITETLLPFAKTMIQNAGTSLQLSD